MKKRKYFTNELERLCALYSDYINEHKDSRLNVLIGDNMIKIHLYRNNNEVDEFSLGFNHKEKDCYNYVSIVIMKMLFCDKIIYSKNNTFFNRNGNLLFEVYDEDLFNLMFSVVPLYREFDFYDKVDRNRRVRNKINRNRNGSNLGERVDFSRELLKRY